jgi:hypothetical protein
MALSETRVGFRAQVMALEMGLFDNLKTKPRPDVLAADICREPSMQGDSSARRSSQ